MTKEQYFNDTLLSAKYNKTLKHFVCMKVYSS